MNAQSVTDKDIHVRLKVIANVMGITWLFFVASPSCCTTTSTAFQWFLSSFNLLLGHHWIVLSGNIIICISHLQLSLRRDPKIWRELTRLKPTSDARTSICMRYYYEESSNSCYQQWHLWFNKDPNQRDLHPLHPYIFVIIYDCPINKTNASVQHFITSHIKLCHIWNLHKTLAIPRPCRSPNGTLSSRSHKVRTCHGSFSTQPTSRIINQHILNVSAIRYWGLITLRRSWPSGSNFGAMSFILTRLHCGKVIL
jgi:hypothetical protein